MEDSNLILVEFSGKKQKIKTCIVFKILNENSELVFAPQYNNETLTRAINDIITKDSSVIQWVETVNITFTEYGLTSRDIINILKKGKVIKSKVTPYKTDIHISMKLNSIDSGIFILKVWLGIDDKIHLGDITIDKGET